MKKLLKKTLKHIDIKTLNIFIRRLRGFSYSLLDFVGYILFLPSFIHSRKDKQLKEKVKKILIIRIDRIGDVILSTPAIRAVRQSYPGAEVHLLITKYTKDLVINNPDLDSLLIYKNDKLNKDYDLAIALHPGFRQNYLSFLSGAKVRVGYTGGGGGFFLTHRLKDDRAKRIRHEVESALEVVRLIGCKANDKHLEVSITEEGEKYAEDYFKKNHLSSQHNIIVIHPGARQEYIRWRKEGFARVADRIIKEKGGKVILIGSEAEADLIEDTARLMTEKPVCVVGWRLMHLVSLIKRSHLFIGNSTGPMHIASALNVPVVAIFGVIHPLDSCHEWGPWGGNHTVVSKDLNCPECHPTDCDTFDCMQLISAEEVFEAAKRKLIKLKKD
jgi:heptosyltransferase-2